MLTLILNSYQPINRLAEHYFYFFEIGFIVIFLSIYSQSLNTIRENLKDSGRQLSITVFAVIIYWLFPRRLCIMWKEKHQPEKFASIGHSFWWAIATLTTVGYGDVYPVTLRRFISGIIAIIGIGYIALPTEIISSAFIKHMEEKKKRGSEGDVCSKC